MSFYISGKTCLEHFLLVFCSVSSCQSENLEELIVTHRILWGDGSDMTIKSHVLKGTEEERLSPNASRATQHFCLLFASGRKDLTGSTWAGKPELCLKSPTGKPLHTFVLNSVIFCLLTRMFPLGKGL